MSKKSKMDILREDLDKAYQQVKADRRMCPQAHEMGNLAGKIINSCKVEVEYASKRGDKPDIPYLNKTEEG